MNTQPESVKNVLKKLCLLWGVEKIIEKSSQVYVTGILTPDAFKLLQDKR